MARFILGTRCPQSGHVTLWVISSSSLLLQLFCPSIAEILCTALAMRLPVSLCPEVVAAAAVLAVLPPLDEVEVEKPGLTPPCCCWAAEPERCRVTRGDRRMPAVGADAGDADEDATSPSGGSLRLLLLLLELELMALIL